LNEVTGIIEAILDHLNGISSLSSNLDIVPNVGIQYEFISFWLGSSVAIFEEGNS